MKGMPSAKATIRPFPAPGVSYRKRRQELMKGILAEEFMDFCRSHPELTEEQALSAFVEAVKDEHPALHHEMVSHGSKNTELAGSRERAQRREVERYLGFPISEGLKQRFEDWLNEHPSISEEDAAAHLLQRGLEHDRGEEPANALTGSARGSSACRARMARLRSLLARS